MRMLQMRFSAMLIIMLAVAVGCSGDKTSEVGDAKSPAPKTNKTQQPIAGPTQPPAIDTWKASGEDNLDAVKKHTATAQAPSDDALVAHYSFDEGQGNVLRDHSGKGNHGKILGPQWEKLADGYALKFDGVDDFVDCDNDESMRGVAKKGTVAVWLKPAKYGGGILSWHTGGSWRDQRWVFITTHKTDDSVSYILADGNSRRKGKWAPPAPLNEWTHYALTVDGKRIRQYANGILLDDRGMGGFISDFGGAPLLLGVSRGWSRPHYQGLLDEIRIYNRALSPAEMFDSFAVEAPRRGKAIPQGTERMTFRTQAALKDRVHAALEDQKLTFNLDISELRPIRKGMAVRIEVPGTGLAKTLPLDPARWKYEFTLDARPLEPGDYVAQARFLEKGGTQFGTPAQAEFRWRKLSNRLNQLRPEDQVRPGVAALDLVSNGKSRATIIIPVKADKWTQKSAKWLVEGIKKSTGVAVKVQKDGTPASGTVISVGHTRRLLKTGLTTEGLRYDGARMVVRENTLFLFGRDGLQFDDAGAKGTCKAVVTFLEDYVGIRWYLPGPEGAVISQRRQVVVPKDLDRTVNPAFGYSHGRYAYGTGTPASFANHFRTALKVKSYGGHAYPKWLPEKKYFNDHPEYFALLDGKRVGKGNHLCSSNPEVAKILLAGIQKDFDSGYDWVALGQEDGYARCQCETCESLDNYRGGGSFETPCERILLLHKWIAEQCMISHPDKTVHMIVYGPTRWPSKKFDKLGDNVVTEMCFIEPKFIDSWKGKVRAMTGYVYWFDITGGPGIGVYAEPARVAQKIRFLHEQGFIGLYQFPETNWGLLGPSFYTLGKLMGDPYLDYRVLQKDYCLGVFGDTAGPVMNDFFTILYAMPKVRQRIWPQGKLQKLNALLLQAEKLAVRTPNKEWIRLTRDHFDYSRLLSRLLTAHNVYKAAPSDKTWAALKARVEEFDVYREKIIRYPESYTDKFFPGHGHFCRYLAGKHIGYRKNWKENRDEILKKSIRGTRTGWGGTTSTHKPLTLDFTKPPHKAVKK